MPFENWHINEYFLVHWRPKFQTLKNCNNFYTLRFWIPLFLQNPLTRVCFICADRAGSFNSCVFEHGNGSKTTRVTDTWGTGILPSPEPKNTFALLPPRSTENRALVSTIITLKNSRKSSLKSCFFLPLLAGLTKVCFVHSIVYWWVALETLKDQSRRLTKWTIAEERKLVVYRKNWICNPTIYYQIK